MGGLAKNWAAHHHDHWSELAGPRPPAWILPLLAVMLVHAYTLCGLFKKTLEDPPICAKWWKDLILTGSGYLYC